MTSTMQRGPATRLYYGWIIVGLGFVTLAFQVVYRFSYSIFQIPLIAEFGWSRGALSWAYSISMLVYALSSPYAGSLLERYGPRAVMPWGCAIVAAASFMGYFFNSIWLVYLVVGLFGGIGLALNGFATNSSIMPRWFMRYRGRATGIALSGIGIGILILLPLVEKMIAMWGWRLAYVGYGLFTLIVITPMSYFLMRNHPRDVGQHRDGTTGEPNPGRNKDKSNHVHTKRFQKVNVYNRYRLRPSKRLVDKSVKTVFLTLKGDPRFWCMMFLYFAVGLNNNTIISLIGLYLKDTGFSVATCALIIGVMGFLRTFGSISGGWLGDRIGRGPGTAISAIVVALGLVLLILLPAWGGGLLLAYTFAAIYGTGIGGMSSCGSALGGDIFEGPTYGVIVGFTEIAYGMGGFIGPPFAGYFFQFAGTYVIPIIIIILFILISIPVVLYLQNTLAPNRAASSS